MPFTDDDLKRCKKWMRLGNHIAPSTQRRLYARLDAAEAALKVYADADRPYEFKVLSAWKKAAGK